MNKKVSIIIVNWNSGDFLKRTIESVYEWTKDISFEVILLDNLSRPDDSSYIYMQNGLEGYEDLKIIYNKDNLGFAKANNVGIDHSCGEYILLLNPDVELHNNAVKILADYMEENQNIGIIGPKVLNPDGTFQASCMRGEPEPFSVLFYLSGINRLFKNNVELNKFSLDHLDRSQIQKVGGLSGCCMMLRKSTIDQIGKMDENFFLYQEETDWCLRASRGGWTLAYNPNALITHEKGVCTAKKAIRNNKIFCQSMLKFFEKHYFVKYNIFQRLFFITLIWMNFGLRCIKYYLKP